MCFSLGRVGGVPVTIEDPGACARRFRTYFDALSRGILSMSYPARRRRRRPGRVGQGHHRRRRRQALGFHYLDSGSLYRLVALKAIRTGTALDDERALAASPRALDVRSPTAG